MNPPIPVVGTAIVNRPDFLFRLFDSIDYPVNNFFVINNNGRGELDSDCLALEKRDNRNVNRIHICTLPRNIGCSGAWNLIIKSFITEPYWLIAGNDVMFMPGFLEKMSHTMNEGEYDMAHGINGDFSVFALNRKVVQKVGLFDESFYPAYFEDIDYAHRLQQTAIRRCLSVGGEYKHGDLVNSYNDASMTLRNEDRERSGAIRRAYVMNSKFFARKWGGNPFKDKDVQLWKHPFNKQEVPRSTTFYNIGFRIRKDVGF